MTATRESLGTICFKSSSCLPLISGASAANPVMLPPGLARLATNPLPTGSVSCAMTIGIVEVDSFTTRVTVGPAETIASTLRRTNSAAISRRRSGFPSAERHSIMMFLPSTYPSSRRPWRNASVRAVMAEAGASSWNPMRGIFICAWTELTVASEIAVSSEAEIVPNFEFIADLSSRLSNHLVRSCQHVGRNSQPDLLGGFEIEQQIELQRLFDRQLGRFGALENLVDKDRRAPKQIICVHAVHRQAAVIDIFRPGVNPSQTVFCRRVDNSFSILIHRRSRHYQERLGPFLHGGAKRRIDILLGLHIHVGDLHAKSLCRRVGCLDRLRIARLCRIAENSQARKLRQNLLEKLQLFAAQLGGEVRQAGHVAAGPRETDNETGPEWVVILCHDDRDRRSSFFRPAGRLRPSRDNHICMPAQDFGYDGRQAILIAVGVEIIGDHEI